MNIVWNSRNGLFADGSTNALVYFNKKVLRVIVIATVIKLNAFIWIKRKFWIIFYERSEYMPLFIEISKHFFISSIRKYNHLWHNKKIIFEIWCCRPQKGDKLLWSNKQFMFLLQSCERNVENDSVTGGNANDDVKASPLWLR